MKGKGWRLTPSGWYWLVELPLSVLVGVLLAAVAYWGLSGF